MELVKPNETCFCKYVLLLLPWDSTTAWPYYSHLQQTLHKNITCGMEFFGICSSVISYSIWAIQDLRVSINKQYNPPSDAIIKVWYKHCHYNIMLPTKLGNEQVIKLHFIACKCLVDGETITISWCGHIKNHHSHAAGASKLHERVMTWLGQTSFKTLENTMA